MYLFPLRIEFAWKLNYRDGNNFRIGISSFAIKNKSAQKKSASKLASYLKKNLIFWFCFTNYNVTAF